MFEIADSSFLLPSRACLCSILAIANNLKHSLLLLTEIISSTFQFHRRKGSLPPHLRNLIPLSQLWMPRCSCGWAIVHGDCEVSLDVVLDLLPEQRAKEFGVLIPAETSPTAHYMRSTQLRSNLHSSRTRRNRAANCMHEPKEGRLQSSRGSKQSYFYLNLRVLQPRLRGDLTRADL